MGRFIKIFFFLFLFVVASEGIYLFFLVKEKGNFRPLQKINRILNRNKELLVGVDFIALSDEKIKELLALPENKGKFICPINPDQNTKIKIVDAYFKDKETQERGDAIIITNFLEDRPSERKLFFPSIDGGKLIGFTANRNYVFFDFGDNIENKIVVVISSPEQLDVRLNKKNEDFDFGDILATGYKNYNFGPPYGEMSISIYRPAFKDGEPGKYLKSSTYLLKYKNRRVIKLLC